jgi:uncharacterized protein
MPMFVGNLRFGARIPESGSLKDKRRYVKSIASRLQSELRLAAAEVGEHDNWHVAEIGVSAVANEAQRVEEAISRALGFVERNWPELDLFDVETETVQAF